MEKTTLNDLSKTRMKYIRRRLSQGIRAAMRKQELNQQELASRSGLHTSSLSDILNEKVNPKTETIARIEAGLGMNVFEILDQPKPFEV